MYVKQKCNVCIYSYSRKTLKTKHSAASLSHATQVACGGQANVGTDPDVTDAERSLSAWSRSGLYAQRWWIAEKNF